MVLAPVDMPVIILVAAEAALALILLVDLVVQEL
jgi:hypothetical protein